jgi:outer membrane protein OmpA-like peptidoglycan-associated protein
MFKFKLIIFVLFCSVFIASNLLGSDTQAYNELISLRDSAKVLEADIFSPKNWEKATKSYEKAREAVMGNKKQKSIDKAVTDAREFTENAIKASEVAKLTLQEYLEIRNKAKTAKAFTLVPELYQKAELQFIKATRKVESGDVKNALKEAVKSQSMYNGAELEAIRVEILGGPDRLIKKAIADDASKYALSTLDKAKTARNKANAIITSNRYNKEDALIESKRAEYEARHASNIALSVRALNRNDQAWEKLMLLYEIQMNRIGNSFGFETLPFDNGPLAAADTLILYITALRDDNKRMTVEMRQKSTDLTSKLQAVVERFDYEAASGDPVKLIQVLDEKIIDLTDENKTLTAELDNTQTSLENIKSKNELISVQLSTRVEKEEKFRKAKTMLNPSEGEVLFNSSNDIVLRLSGLSFDIGKSDVQDEHIPLLEKVKQVIQLFPDVQIVVEGHTDASGEAAANVSLSEKRAFSVMQYLRQSLLIPADQISSMGYGADKPVGSNQTKDGRAKNRRIDIILMR